MTGEGVLGKVQLIQEKSGEQSVSFKWKVFVIRFIVVAGLMCGYCKDGFGQSTFTTLLDFTGTNGVACPSAGGPADATYSSASGNVVFAGGIPSTAVISNIAFSVNLGQFLSSSPVFSFTLNGTAIGSISGVTATCQTNVFNASTVTPYNKTTNNTLAFTATGGGTRGVYNVRVTVTYCVPPGAPSVTTPINYCQFATASQLTATGTNLLWYTGPTGGTGSATAPTPSTTSTGTTTFYVSQNTGCEGPRAAIVVNVNGLPVATVSNQSNISCFALGDGTITITASGGAAPYSFSVDNGASWHPPTTGTTISLFTGLLPNTPYRIRVRIDNTGCISR